MIHNSPNWPRPFSTALLVLVLSAALGHRAEAQRITDFSLSPDREVRLDWEPAGSRNIYVVERSSFLSQGWWKANGRWPIGRNEWSDRYSTTNLDRQFFRLQTWETPIRPAGYSRLSPITCPGTPGALAVTENHDLVVYTLNSGDPNPFTVRFLETSYAEGNDSFSHSWTPEIITVAWDAALPEAGVMAYERHRDRLFVLGSTRLSSGNWWYSMRLYVIRSRQISRSHNYNRTAKLNGSEPRSAPLDFRYDVEGMTIKPAWIEGNSHTRLFIDDTVKGNIDILDINGWGDLADQERISYRARLNCTWPDTDPPPWSCSTNHFFGNTIAVDWLRESQPRANDPLLSIDRIFLADANHPDGPGRIWVMDVGHPGEPVSAAPQPLIDLTPESSFFSYGQGLYLSAEADRAYYLTGVASFSEGFMMELDATTGQNTAHRPPGQDLGHAVADPLFPQRLFVACDGGLDHPNRIVLHVFENGAFTDSLLVRDPPQPVELRGMAYDAEYGLLYLSLGDGIIEVVRCPIRIE